MGERVDSATNKKADLSEHPVGMLATEEAVFCVTCGTPDDESPQGFAPVDYAEANWVAVGRALACSIYCAAKEAGFTEEQAQLARAKKTQLDLREAGLEAQADHDEALVNDVLENPQNHPFAPAFEDVASPEATDHGVEADTQASALEDEFDAIVKQLKDEGGEE